MRRDFTINGLFYDAPNHRVIDFAGGWDDIHKGVLRTIGDPVTRFRQDPVRMLRALKFRARFGFSIAEDTLKGIEHCREEILKSAPARVLEEMFRMLESGASEPFIKMMTEFGFMKLLFPVLSHILQGPHGDKVYQYLAVADKMNSVPDLPTLDRSVLASCLLYPILEQEIDKQFLSKDHTPHLGDITILATSLIQAVVTSSFSHFPRRISAAMTFILTTQYRFTPLTSKRHYRASLFRDNDYPHALTFLKVRSILDANLVDTYVSWKKRSRRQQQAPQKKGPPPPHYRRRRART